MNPLPLHKKDVRKIISLNEVEMYVIDPGIIVSEFKPDVYFDMQLAKIVHEKTLVLTNGTAMPYLFIPGEGQQSETEVSRWGATEEATKYTSAIAVVVRSLPHRISINFFIRFLKPARPTKAFTDISDAISWLHQFVR